MHTDTQDNRMAHASHEDLERCVLDSPVLSSEAKAALRAHCLACAPCREILEEIAGWNAAFASASDHPMPGAAAFLARVRHRAETPAAAVIELFPRIPTSLLAGARPSLIALAAQDANPAMHYSTVGNLASADQRTILHVVRDNAAKEFVLQVHSDTVHHYANVLVTFDAIPGEYLTDESGELRIPNAPVADFSRVHASLRVQLDRFPITAIGRAELALGARTVLPGTRGHRLDVSRDGRGAALRVSGDIAERDGATHVGYIGAQVRSVVALRDGCARLPVALIEMIDEFMLF